MSARHSQREGFQVAVETHLQQRPLQHLAPLGRDSEPGAVQQPHGIHRAVETAHGIGRVVVAVVEYRTVALEAGGGAFGNLVAVVDPAREGLQIGNLAGCVGQHQQACQPPRHRGIEGVDIDSVHLRTDLHLAHARKPLHGPLHLAVQPGPDQHVAHEHGRRIEVAHAVAQVVQRTQTAAGREALIEQVAGQREVHFGQLPALGRVGRTPVADGHLEQQVVALAQQLTAVRKSLLHVGTAQIDIGLGVADEEKGLSLHRPVGIPGDAVIGKLLAQRLHRRGLSPLQQQPLQTTQHGVHLPLLLRGDGRLGCDVQLPAPRLQQHQPVAVRPGVDERGLGIGRMVPHVLERRGNPVVEVELAPLRTPHGHHQFVHPLLGRPLHVAVEGHPGSAPAGEAQPVVEPGAGAALFAELETQLAPDRLRGIEPEDEGRHGGLLRIGVLGQVADRPAQDDLRPLPAPLPAGGAEAVFVVFAARRELRTPTGRKRRSRLLEREEPAAEIIGLLSCGRSARQHGERERQNTLLHSASLSD